MKNEMFFLFPYFNFDTTNLIYNYDLLCLYGFFHFQYYFNLITNS